VAAGGDPGVYRALTEIKQQLSAGGRKTAGKKPQNKKTNGTSAKSGKQKSVVQKTETKIDGFIHRAVKQFQVTLSDPFTLVLVAVVFFAAYTHHYNADDSIVKKITAQLKEHEALKPLGEWIDSNIPKFFGVMMAVAAAMSLKETVRYSTMVCSTVLIMMFPATTITFYAITVASALLYMRLKVKSDRFIVAGFIFVVYAYYFLDIKKRDPTPAAPAASAAPSTARKT